MSNIITAPAASKVKDGIINWTRNARALAALAEFKALKVIEAAGAKAEHRRKTEVEPILREELQGANVVIVRGITALKVISSSNGKVDASLLKAAWPEAYEATFKSTSYTYIKVI